MSGYLLDTDHLSILQHSSQPECSILESRMARFDDSQFSVSIVSFQEEALGWNAFLNQARRSHELVYGYQMLQDMVSDFQRLTVVPFDANVAEEFERLKTLRLRVGTMDLRIGASAIVHEKIILTRNSVDFERISGLRCQDWTVNPPNPPRRNLIRR
jgi:tRNA(fMet)-specific endonuclease VapC